MTSLDDLSLTEAAALLERRALTSRELTAACLARAEQRRSLNSVIALLADRAMVEAEDSDRRRAAGAARGPLDGIPLGVKDNILLAGVPATAGSNILRRHVAAYDATAVERLRRAGAVLLAKLNLDEFGMGSSNENSAFGPCRNPWDESRTPGGSSGGAAAAVAAGLCLGCLGTDTGGSIRQPAAFCGVSGLRPTYGRVSRYGVIAFASSLDQVGPLGRSAGDVALLMNAIAGHDPRDSTSAPRPVPDFAAAIGRGVRGLRVGLPREYFELGGCTADVAAAVRDAIAVLEAAGARVSEIALPHTRYAIACYYLIATAEASSNLARYDGVRYGDRVDPGRGLAELYLATRGQGFGAEVKRRILLGTFVLSAGYYDAYYRRAQQVRTLISRDFEQAFAAVDVIAAPIAPTPAFALGEKTADPLTMYLSDIFTISVNLGGVCGMSVPCGLSAGPRPLPIGLQLIGRPFDEESVLAAAGALQEATDWHRRRPPEGGSGRP
ncbi:MAG: Asp-tRNA(Asn)/Glu-tRNA(Gln) amidotransferase subunit GatA [Deltaproteobacteria bacterium]|nr:Asp-tRNA(Asn)/Glu-tRNA(Gln) amidotransferase subunit GatA [Deltaproteobacteria bacterium]